MTILRTADNRDLKQCDGCGRSDDNLGIREYPVNDPNIGSAVLHHYCAHCAGNRGLSPQAQDIPGWIVTSAPVVAEQAAAEAEPSA